MIFPFNIFSRVSALENTLAEMRECHRQEIEQYDKCLHEISSLNKGNNEEISLLNLANNQRQQAINLLTKAIEDMTDDGDSWWRGKTP